MCYWGGFAFIPYYFEFWEGNTSRLNKRDVYKIQNDEWNHTIIEPWGNYLRNDSISLKSRASMITFVTNHNIQALLK